MARFDNPRRREAQDSRTLLKNERGSSLVEFAVVLPLLVVFVVGVYDFSAAFEQKQKIDQSAQEGAIVAGAQPMSDIQTTNGSPSSLQPVVTAVFNSLAGSGVLTNANQGTCKLPASPGWVPAAPTGLTWTYTITGCSAAYPNDALTIAINRGQAVCPSTPCAAGSTTTVDSVVTVTYPYHWRFGSVIQLLISGPNGYGAPTQVTDSAAVHNQT
jgi:Flp pilus assembly protein TadG